jgi:hypothetical protein
VMTPPNAYLDLLKRLTLRLQARKVDNQILEILQQAVEEELAEGDLVLSRAERRRLFPKVAKVFLIDLLARLDDQK